MILIKNKSYSQISATDKVWGKKRGRYYRV